MQLIKNPHTIVSRTDCVSRSVIQYYKSIMSFKTKQEFLINIMAINDREAVVIVQDTST